MLAAVQFVVVFTDSFLCLTIAKLQSLKTRMGTTLGLRLACIGVPADILFRNGAVREGGRLSISPKAWFRTRHFSPLPRNIFHPEEAASFYVRKPESPINDWCDARGTKNAVLRKRNAITFLYLCLFLKIDAKDIIKKCICMMYYNFTCIICWCISQIDVTFYKEIFSSFFFFK